MFSLAWDLVPSIFVPLKNSVWPSREGALGHFVNKEGVAVDPDKVEAFQDKGKARINVKIPF